MLGLFEKLLTHPFIHTGAHIGYFSGLTTMLPLISQWWETDALPWVYSPKAFYIGLGLIALSLFLLSFAAKGLDKLLRSLGWLMIIPGALAIGFSLFGEASFWGSMNLITGFHYIEPGVQWLVHHSVPNAAFIGAVYIFSGMILIWAGRKVELYASYI